MIKMEIAVTLNYTGIGFGEFSNSSNTSTESTFVEDTFRWTNAEIARLIQIIFRPILVIVGTIGNCLTIYIMRRTSLRNLSSCFYMVILALADSSKQILFIYSLLKAKNFGW